MQIAIDCAQLEANAAAAAATPSAVTATCCRAAYKKITKKTIKAAIAWQVKECSTANLFEIQTKRLIDK